MTLAYSPNAAALLTATAAALLTALIVPVVRRLGLRWGLVDPPDDRKQHTGPMVRLGGVGIVVGFSLSLACTWTFGGFAELPPDKDQLIWTTLAGALCFFVIGLADDLFALPPLPRLCGQVLVAAAVWNQGVRIGSIDLPLGLGTSVAGLPLPEGLSLLATVVWLVGITNAINWLDGLDGLAAGVSGIAAVGLLSVSFSLSQPAAGLLAAALAGSCLGFLRHNFNPARIFMGDAGAMLLGLLLAVTTITIGGRTADQFSGQTYFFFAPLVIPIVILGVPIADTAFSFFRRLLRRQSVSQADREHLHHRLMRLGHGPRRSVVILWLWTAVLSAAALVPTYTNRGNSLVPIALAALALLLYSYFHPGVVRLRRRDRAARDDRSGADPVDPVGPRAPDEPPGPAATIVDLEARRRAAGGS